MSDETGKCRTARRRLVACAGQIKEIKEQLDQVWETLSKLVTPKGQRPGRLRFTPLHMDIQLYVDFRFECGGDEVEGVIVYGALRDPCYPHSLLSNPDDKKEERPLIRFSVDAHGKICAKGKLTDEWWLCRSAGTSETETEAEKEKHAAKKAVEEMHYRALDCICGDALNWVNEPFLP